MPLQLLPCTDADMARTFAILSDAFGHEHPYIEAAFPAHETPSGRAVGGERMLAIKNSDPTATFLKVVDTETGEMIAQAKWNIFQDNIPPELDLDGDFWGDDTEEKEYAQHLCRDYLILRRKAIKESGGNLVCMCLLLGGGVVSWTGWRQDENGIYANGD
jgi:hypothetical protein